MTKSKDEKKALCFVIGPIGKEGTSERKHADLLLHAVIKEVLEADEFGYRVKRADEDADPGMIGDRVVTDIISADLVVADLTDLNPNAFYELGIRHSTQQPTIHLAKAGTALPFDNVGHRTIFIDLADWQSIVNARAQLAEATRAIKEPGYRVSNPITQANATFKMRESADPRDRVLAELQERMRTLEAQRVQELHEPIPPRPLGPLRRAFINDIVSSLAGKDNIAIADLHRELKRSGMPVKGSMLNNNTNKLDVAFQDGTHYQLDWPPSRAE